MNSHSLFGQKKCNRNCLFFWYLSFHCCSNGCFSSTHNVKDPIVRNGFPVWALKKQREVRPGLDHRKKDLGLQELEPQAVLLRHASLWVRFVTNRGRHFITDGSFCLLEPAVVFEASHIEAERGLDFHSSHSQQTINDIESNSHNLNGSTSSTHPLFLYSLLYFKQWKHAYHHTSKETHHFRPTHRAGLPQISSVLLFMLSLLKAFSLKKKSLVDFVLWLAISKVQS